MLSRTQLVFSLAILANASCSQQPKPADNKPIDGGVMPRVAFDIERGGESWGTLVLELFPKESPQTVSNFLRYVNEGYYDGTIIHRVIVGSNVRIQVLQGGGYTELNGPAKPGQHAPIPLESNNGLMHVSGTIAMARDAEPDTATSEYFINLGANPSLNYASPEKPGYCVFGRVVAGFEVLNRIRTVETRVNPDPVLRGEKSQPLDPPVVMRAYRL
jgi:cyclophilin family peptidyl-prolyl cis-trans isomerase